jgi:hypothetical protein
MKTIVLFFLLSSTVFSQTKLSVNPGIKLGLAFGEKVQFIFGYELSFVMYSQTDKVDGRYGIVFDYDSIDGIKRLHIGFEYMYRMVGLDVGPTFAWKESILHYGFSIIPFGGAILVPYMNYTNIEGMPDQFDCGAYFKLPIPLSKERFSVGG